jgi:hypothetical protein
MQRSVLFIHFLIISVIIGIILPLTASEEILFPLKPSPPMGPYDDRLFLDNATSQITGLSGKIIPYEGTELLKLKSAQTRLSKMNISPDFFHNASLVNEYLYITVKTGETYGTTKRMTDHPETLGSPEYDQYTKAREYYADSLKTWNNISSMFPNITPPKLPDPERPVQS